jgi:DNA-directed RNA polymerase specialized sigma subunit
MSTVFIEEMSSPVELERARARQIEAYLPLVRSLARRFVFPGRGSSTTSFRSAPSV